MDNVYFFLPSRYALEQERNTMKSKTHDRALLQLFVSILSISAFTFGGYAAMPLIRAQVVDAKGWMTLAEFADLITIAEMTPGPIQLNAATFAGTHVAGLAGAVFATMGVVAPSLILVTLLAWIYARYHDIAVIKGVLGSLRPAVVALIASAGLSILLLVFFGSAEVSLQALRPRYALLFILALILLRAKKMSPILVMLLCGVLSLVFGMILG